MRAATFWQHGSRSRSRKAVYALSEKRMQPTMTTVLRALGGFGLLLAALDSAHVDSAHAAAPCCARCGKTKGQQAICRPIYTTMQVEYTEWDCVPEVVGLPRRSLFPLFPPQGGKGASDIADSDACCGDTPADTVGCKVRCRNKLVRKTLVKEVPVWKYVIEYVCCQCRDGCASSSCGHSGNQPGWDSVPTESQAIGTHAGSQQGADRQFTDSLSQEHNHAGPG